MISEQQAEVLKRIDAESIQLEKHFQTIQQTLGQLPDDLHTLGDSLTNIQLPEPQQLAEQLVHHLMVPLVEPLNQLNDAAEIIQSIPDKVEAKLNELETEVEALQEAPASLQESFDETNEQVTEAIEYLSETVSSNLIPQWSEVEQIFTEAGEMSLSDFEQALQITLNELDDRIKDTVKQAFDRQFRAITQARDDTEGLMENTTQLAQRIQEICTVLAQAEMVLNEETQRANVGVDKTIETINDIESTLRSKLPI